MSQPVDFLEYLRYWNGTVWKYYTFDGTTVSETTTKTKINHSPEGWKEYTASLERGWTYYGLTTSHGAPLKFMKDAAAIVRYVYYTYGIEGELNLLIEQLDRSTYDYATYFESDLDLSKCQDDIDYIVCPIIENGHIEKIKSYDDTEFEYDLETNSLVEWCRHDGLNLQSRLFFNIPLNTSEDGASFSDAVHDFPLFVYVGREGTNISTPFWDIDTANPWTDLFGNDTAASIDYRLDAFGHLIIAPNGGYGGGNYVKLVARINNSTGGFVSEQVLWTSPAPLPTGAASIYYFTLDEIVSVDSTYRCTIAVKVDGSANSLWATTVSSIELSVSFENRYSETYIPILNIMSLFSMLMKSITEDNTIIVSSSLLTTTYNSEHYFTSGNGLRGLANSKIRLSLRQLFNFVNTKFGASLTYDKASNTVYLENKAYVFENVVNSAYTSIEVAKFSCTPLTSELATNIDIGSRVFNTSDNAYDDEDINNGKYEANVTNSYKTPLSRMSGKRLDMLPDVRDDIYGIESVRINLTDKILADSSNDNDVFALHMDVSALISYTIPETGVVIDYMNLYRKPIDLTIGATYWNIENVYDPASVYNIIYSPARCVYANGPYFRSLYKMNDSDSFTFINSGKNTATGLGMITTEGATPLVIDEHDSIVISSLCVNDDVLFLPYIFEVTVREQINFYSIINSSEKFRYLPFIYRGFTFNAFILKATSKPAFRSETILTLLSHPDNDLTNLIYANGF